MAREKELQNKAPLILNGAFFYGLNSLSCKDDDLNHLKRIDETSN